MKYLILAFMLITSIASADTLTVTGGSLSVSGGSLTVGTSGGGGGSTARASFTLNSAGGSGSAQVYDSIAAAWVGGGCNTADFSSGYLEANSATDRCYIPGSYLQKDAGNDGITIKFEYQVSNASDANLEVLDYSAGGDDISWNHYVASSTGRVLLRADYSSTYPDVSWTNDSYAVNTWHTVVLQIDFVAQDMNMTINGTQPAGYVENNLSGIADWGTLSGNLYLGYVGSGTNAIRLRNLAIYNGLVTP